MDKVTLEQVNVKDEQTSKSGKKYRLAGIKVDSKWYNGFASPEVLNWKAGDTVTVELFQEEYNGSMYDKFKTPNKFDILEKRVEALEARMGMPNAPMAPETQQPAPTITPPVGGPSDLPF